MSFDASVIDLCASLFDWTAYDHQKEQPGFENSENLVPYACKSWEINVILSYFGQQ